MAKQYLVKIPQVVSYTEWSVYEVEAETEAEAIEKAKNDNHGSYPYYEDDTDFLYEESPLPPKVEEI